MGKMLKFESQSRLSGFKCTTLPLEKQPSSLSKMRRKFIPSLLGEDGRQHDSDSTMITGLPVPTVPPYPIELFENGGELGHTNRAFNITDEFLSATNQKVSPHKHGRESSGTGDEGVSNGRPSPEGAVHSICSSTGKDDSLQDTKDSKVQIIHNSSPSSDSGLPSKNGSLSDCVIYSNTDIKDRSPPNGSSPVSSNAPTSEDSSSCRPSLTNGPPPYVGPEDVVRAIPYNNSVPHSTQIPNRRPHFSEGHFLNGVRHPLMQNNHRHYPRGPQFHSHRPNLNDGPNSDRETMPIRRPITNGGLIRPRHLVLGHSFNDRMMMDNRSLSLAAQGPPNKMRGHTFNGGPISSRRIQPHPQNTGTGTSSLHYRDNKRQWQGPLPSVPGSTNRVPENSAQRNPRVYMNQGEPNQILNINNHSSSKSREPPNPPSENVGAIHSVNVDKTPGPIYSKVCKPKKNRKSKSDASPNKTYGFSNRVLSLPRSPSSPFSLVKQSKHGSNQDLKPIVPCKRTLEENSGADPEDANPLYEDLREFDDDRLEERQYNIEVKIDYSRSSKYQMETRHVVATKSKNSDQTISSDKTKNNKVTNVTVTHTESKKEKAISKKLRDIGEMKTFKLGVIHVIRVGKWRFVALCCCGNTNRYVHQPGRIEDYVPGRSSLSEKEQRKKKVSKHPEADIKLEAKSQEPPPTSANHRYGSQKMSMTHALKESGYESDSTLVFKKREDARRQIPDPRKTSQVYRQIQRGGDIPFTGLQKAPPARPKDPEIGPLPFPYLSGRQASPPRRPESPYKYESGEVNIHYRTPVRIEQKDPIPEEELARRQEEHMKKVYENERRKKYLAELEDIERRRHTDNFTPLQKSPIPLNRYDEEASLGTLRGARTPEPKQVAKALYNFTAQNKRELTFNKGEIIFIRRLIDKNWYEGELRGSVGIFPCNYVEIVPYDNIKSIQRKPTEGQARARFNFQAQTSMEMSLNKGELVVLSRRVDENWYEGRISNRKGIFPVSYVDTLVEPGPERPMTPSSSPMPRPALPAANLLYNGASSYSSPYSTLGRPGSQNDSRPYNQSLTVNTQQEPIPYRALYNYKPQNDDELELLESDIVLVMEKCDDGWFVGTSRRTGLFGTFPGNYVEKV